MNRCLRSEVSRGVVGAAGILFAAWAGAQTAPEAAKPPTAVATNVQDYSQGFRTFIRMGLPDTAKGTYVELVVYRGNIHDSSFMSGMHEVSLSGNAWLISENKEGKSLLVTTSGRTLELFDRKTVQKRAQAEAISNAVARSSAKGQVAGTTHPLSDESEPTGSWTPKDLSRDLAKATAFVEKKLQAKAAGGRAMRYDSFIRSDEAPGALFLLAALAWQNGKVQEANALAGALFTLAGDSRKVILGAVNVMADAQLAGTVDAFQATHDWAAYQASVDALLKRYPAGWRNAGAAKMLAERLQTRAALTTPPAIVGEGLDATDRALADALAMETGAAESRGGSGDFWFLPPAKSERAMKDDSVIGRIRARGLQSVPLLLALAGDETLCPLRRNDVGMSTRYSSYDSEQPEEERTLQSYRDMDRPQTRGEIARHLLEPLCRQEQNEQHSAEEVAPEEVVEAAREAYATLKTVPPADLAGHFLKTGDDRQKQAAIAYMLQNDVATNAPVIEAYLLEPPSDEREYFRMGHGNGSVMQYVQKRGEAAAAFVEKYAAMREKIELPAGMAGNEEFVKQKKKQAETEIKRLRALVKKADLSEVIASLVAADDDDEGAMMAYGTLGNLPAATAVPALLAAAVQATNVHARSRVLQMMPMLRLSGMEAGMEQEMEAMESPEAMEAMMKQLAEKNKVSIGTNAPAWRILLADTRAMPKGGRFDGDESAMTIADLAAVSIDTLYGNASPMDQYSRRSGIANLRPEATLCIMRARAEARLAGKPEDELPKMPSADEVSAARRKAIETDLSQATPLTLGKILDGLTDAESLYLAEAADENEAVMKALSLPSRRILSVKTDATLPKDEVARLKKLDGALVSTNVIAELRECCRRQLVRGTPLVVSLASAGLGRGLSIKVEHADKSSDRMYSGYLSAMGRKGSQSKGMITGMLVGGEEGYGHGMWLVDLPAPAVPAGAAAAAPAGTAAVPAGTATADAEEEDDEIDEMSDSMESSFAEQQEEFEEAVRTFCKSDEPLGQGASISFTGVILSQEKNDGDDEADDGDVDLINVDI